MSRREYTILVYDEYKRLIGMRLIPEVVSHELKHFMYNPTQRREDPVDRRFFQ